MWFFNRKKASSLTDEDRESSAITRRQNRELKDLEHEIKKLDIERRKLEAQAEIEDLRAELYGDEEEGFNPEELLINILTKGQGLQSLINNQLTPTSPPPQPLKRELSDEEIRLMMKDVNPDILKQAKKLDKEKIADFIRQKDSTISEDSIQRIVVMVKCS